MTPTPHITVCICTYRRKELLTRLLESLNGQETDGLFSFSVVIADNDQAESARATVTELAPRLGYPIEYCVEPRKNIALVRNKAVAQAKGDFIAFIDDDEFPVSEWLKHAITSCQRLKVAGVLGPVEPHFDEDPPGWLRRGGFYQRPRHETGFPLAWPECRTGNVLLRRSILEGVAEPFHAEFGSGGEDQDFFRRMIEAGHRFVWCDEAVAYETVPPSRWKRKFLLSRALLRGRNSLRQRKHRLRNLLKSAVAVPLYAIALPILLIVGHHYFMRYLVKLADHAGRLLALAGLNPVRERQM